MNKLKEIITRDCGWRLQWVAKEIGLSPTYFSNKVAGRFPFTDVEIDRLGGLIGVNLRVLRSEIQRLQRGAASPE